MSPSFKQELSLYKKGYKTIAGIDEAGRGAWAGPLVMAAVILPRDFDLRGWGINDSKSLSPKARGAAYSLITKYAPAYNVSIIQNDIIDKVWLREANQKAVTEAYEGLKLEPDYLLIDEMKIQSLKPATFIIDGDKKVASIAAASIIAKVTRDRLMIKWHERFPEYGFNKHKGYGTRLHQQRLEKYGVCKIHRRSFKPVKKFHPADGRG